MKHSHLTIEDRNIILTGICNNASLQNIGKTIGKDPTTVKKEIMLHREISYRSILTLECANYKKCNSIKTHLCNKNCKNFALFYCKRRDKTPGACNGCSYMPHCRFTKFKYNPALAQHQYQTTKTESREGCNLTHEEAKELADIVKPLLSAGQSPYMIIQSNPQIKITERTLYTYIENGVLKEFGIDAFLLRRQLSRKLPKKKRNNYKKRNDYRYLQGRKYEDFLKIIEENPNIFVVQMDTVYNDITNGPFIQTFKFINLNIIFAIYHTEKTAESMVEGVNMLEELLGHDLFRKYVPILLTDRGAEFVDAVGLETGIDGEKRTSVYYCDPMQSCQKGSLESRHKELRYHFPKEKNLKEIGLTSQSNLNLSLSHINSMPLESIGGKSAFEYASFLYPDFIEKIKEFGIYPIEPNSIILNPTLLKK